MIDSPHVDDEVESVERLSVPDDPAESHFRYRARFAKVGSLRYISHLDLARLWERTLRRAGARLVYSQGFNPRPKIQLASGLPLGHESVCELVDFWLTESVASFEEFRARLADASPEGLQALAVEAVDIHGPALQSITDRAIYEVRFKSKMDRDWLKAKTEWFMGLTECLRVRRDKPYDLRPLVDQLRVIGALDVILEMTLALSQGRGTARPDEVIQALDIDPIDTRITRTAIHFVAE